MTDLVLLTGISGFIAKHVAEVLLAEGYRLRGTLRDLKKAAGVRAALDGQGVDTARLEFVQADLSSDEGWDAAMAGVRFVQHTASPFPSRLPKDKLALVPIAKGGTLRVVAAARRAGVDRLILTSSVAAVYYGHRDRLDPRYDERDVSVVESPDISAYAVSKTMAELAAWEAVSGSRMELAAINPALVLGPLMDQTTGTSADIIAMMMKGRMPLVPDVALGIVDVRDVALAHLRAMQVGEAVGRRFLLSAGSRTLIELGAALGTARPAYRRAMPRFVIPDGLVRAAARVSASAAQVAPELGARKILVTEPAQTLLGLRFRPPEEALLAMADSLIRLRLA